MSNNLPEQVKKQSAEIQALYEEMGPGSEPEAGKEPEKKAPTVAAVDDDTVSSAEKERKKAEKSGKKKDEEGEDYKQKYLTLQGMYNTDVPKLRTQAQDYEKRIKNMESLLASMKPVEAAPSALEVTAGSIVTEDDVKEYGEALEVMRRVSREELGPIMRKLKELESTLDSFKEVVPKVDRIVTGQAKTAEQQFWNKIDKAIPNWKAINGHQDFVTWLFSADPMTGQARQDLLDDAQKKADADRVIHIFKTWIGETGYGEDSETEVAHVESNTELESQVAPGKGRGGGHISKGEKPSFTRAEIGAFYGNVAKGAFKGRDAERIKIESDIFQAQQDGRVT